MTSRTKTNKASLQGMATGRALLQVFAVSLITSGVVLSANANERKTAIITFDAPGAGTGGPFQGTLVAGITPAGVITGGFLDANEVEHTYLRFPDGTFTTFDAPGAGTGPFQGTGPNGLNPAGAITGSVVDANNVGHGYMRAKDGTITNFDAPGAGTDPGQGTSAFGINPAGVIEGQYTDASNVPHGFVRDANGAITAFDVPGAGTGTFQGSFVFSEAINHAGAIAGAYFDSSNVVHGFLRTP